jgi:uncharacterized membrane protein YczE
MCSIGVAVIGSGVGALRYGNFGIDPYMSLSNGLFISFFDKLGISFGTSFLLLCLIFFLVPLFFDRSKIGAGTLVNMVLTGYGSDFTLFLLNKIPFPESAAFFARIFIMFCGVVVISFGSGIYLNTNIGTSPYDALGLILAEKFKKPGAYRWVRIGTDLVCTVLGFLMGSIPGIGTLIMALFTGPLITFFRVRVLVWGRRLGIIRW